MGFLLEAVDDQAEQMGVPRSQRDWGFIGYAAFGNIGRLLFAGCMFFDLTGGHWFWSASSLNASFLATFQA